jgi:inosine/xanthosine triphosphate pyrophosphatase family protein
LVSGLEPQRGRKRGKELLLGTTNPAKVHIVCAAVESLPIRIVTPDDLDLQIDVPEEGRSTAENAEQKARAYFAAARIPTLSIDGGLQIEGLPAEKQRGAHALCGLGHGPE